MGTQRELFETNQTKWVETVWLSMSTAVRQEICAILARMGRAAVGGKADGNRQGGE